MRYACRSDECAQSARRARCPNTAFPLRRVRKLSPLLPTWLPLARGAVAQSETKGIIKNYFAADSSVSSKNNKEGRFQPIAKGAQTQIIKMCAFLNSATVRKAIILKYRAAAARRSSVTIAPAIYANEYFEQNTQRQAHFLRLPLHSFHNIARRFKNQNRKNNFKNRPKTAIPPVLYAIKRTIHLTV